MGLNAKPDAYKEGAERLAHETDQEKRSGGKPGGSPSINQLVDPRERIRSCYPSQLNTTDDAERSTGPW
jgi:hypothetical protein